MSDRKEWWTGRPDDGDATFEHSKFPLDRIIQGDKEPKTEGKTFPVTLLERVVDIKDGVSLIEYREITTTDVSHKPETERELLWFPETVYEIDGQGDEREIHYPTTPHRYNHITGKIYGQQPGKPKFHNRRERRAYHRYLKSKNMAADL